MTTITIPRRFCGPPNSGNGGYVCGRLAQGLSGPVSVTLRKPPPMDRPLRVCESSGKRRLFDGEELVAVAERASLNLEVPAPPCKRELESLRCEFEGLDFHAYPYCFVCGPQREAGDGLRIFVRRCADNLVATQWTPDASLGQDRLVDPAFFWAAMDCPGYWSLRDKSEPNMLLGKLTAEILEPLQIGCTYTVIAWDCGREGRKARVGTALYSQDGTLMGRAEGIWITLKAPLRQALNLCSAWPTDLSEEFTEDLASSPHCRVERILSLGQKTAEGEWLEQEQAEFVLLHSGHAKLRFEGDSAPFDLYPGDYVCIPAGQRHRVEWTDPAEPSVWLAIHF